MPKYVDIEIPSRGFTSDADPNMVPSDTATQWVNLRLDRPGVMEPRPRWTGYTDHESVAGTSAAQYSWNFIQAQLNVSAAAPMGLLTYAELPTDLCTGGVTSYKAIQIGTTGIAVDAVAAFNTSAKVPLTPAANLYGAAYYVRGTDVYVWSGGRLADDSTLTFTINAGSKSGTLSGTPASPVTGRFLVDTNSRVVNGEDYYYVAYPVVNQSGTSFELGVPYGLGIPGWTINASGASCTLSDLVLLGGGNSSKITHHRYGFSGAANEINAIVAHQDRIFVAPRAMLIKWSDATRPQVWPANNYAYIEGEADSIVAMHSTGRELLIFTQRSTWVMLGDSESNYTLRKLSSDAGCGSPHAVTTWNNTVIVAGYHGVYAIGPDLSVADLTYVDDSRGVNSYYRANYGDPLADSYGRGFCFVDTHNDHLFITMGTRASSNPTMVCYLPRNSWAVWSNANAAPPWGLRNFWRVGISASGTPEVRVNVGNSKTYLDMDTVITDAYEERYTWQDTIKRNGTTVTYNIPVTAEFPRVRLASGDTFTVNHVYVEHNTMYVDSAFTGTGTVTAGSQAGSVNGYTVRVRVWPAGATNQTVTLEPRYELNYGSDHRYYVTEFPSPGTFAQRGNLMNIKFESTARTWAFCNGVVYHVRAAIEPGRPGTTDVPVL